MKSYEVKNIKHKKSNRKGNKRHARIHTLVTEVTVTCISLLYFGTAALLALAAFAFTRRKEMKYFFKRRK